LQDDAGAFQREREKTVKKKTILYTRRKIFLNKFKQNVKKLKEKRNHRKM